MRALRVFMVVIAGVGAVAAASQHFFSARVQQITRGNDPSYFYRVTGPVLVAGDTIERHPIAGAGLTGEERIADRIRRIYRASPAFSPRWRIDEASTVITNYFWHHWIYLGLIWGVAALFAVTWFLRTLGPPSLLFCWAVWAVMGQASGAYVSPKPWATLLIACAIALLHYRQPGRLVALRRPAPFSWQRRSEAPA